jgi:hypothetical protein
LDRKLTTGMNESAKQRVNAILSKGRLTKRMESLKELRKDDGLDLGAKSSA